MVLVLYASPNPVIDETKILNIIDEAVEKTGIEAYALVNDTHVSVILEPTNTNEI